MRTSWMGVFLVVIVVAVGGPTRGEAFVPNVVDDFESADFWDDWSVDGGTWQWGAPTSGPNAAHHGDNVVATVLDGNYVEDTSGRLTKLSSFVVPPAEQHPRLRLWHWFQFAAYDSGALQISVAGGPWETLPGAAFAGYSGGTWSRPSFDLSAYAGESVRISFWFESHGHTECGAYSCWWAITVAPGWYIDELVLETGATRAFVPDQVESFEDEGFWDDWSSARGTWEHGVPTSGPAAAHDGDHVIATIVAGNYGEDTSSRLESPAFDVPAADELPRLRFWHYYQFAAYDWGAVQISVEDGEWETLPAASFSGYSGGTWSRPSLDLTAYAGKRVRIGFWFESHGHTECGAYSCWWAVTVAPGWYLDELVIETGAVEPLVPDHVESFEGAGFWDDWSSAAGTWEHGVPTSGPGAAHAGDEVIATILDGDYGEDTASRLESPVFEVPPASENPRLRFWHYYQFAANDSGSVQIRTPGADWQTLNDCATSAPVRFAGSGGGIWSRPCFDLAPFAGQRVQLGFWFESHGQTDCGAFSCWWAVSVAPGWYIDELVVKTDSGPVETAVPGTPTPKPTATKTATVHAPTATGSSPAAPTPTPLPAESCPPDAECVTGNGEVTTDDEHDGATPDDQVETTVVPPTHCTTSIVEQPLRDRSERGYQFLGQSVAIDSCTATASDPIMILFDVHRSMLRAPNQNPMTVSVFREGKLIAPCVGAAGQAVPAPCVAERAPIQNGDGARFTILTEHASPWNVGNGLDAFLCRTAKASKGSAKLEPIAAEVEADAGSRTVYASKPGALCEPTGFDGTTAGDPATALQAFALKVPKVCANDRLRACASKQDCVGADCVKKSDALSAASTSVVQTALGALALEAAPPTTLLVPSASAPNGTVALPPDPQSHNVASFACGKAKLAAATTGLEGRAVTVQRDVATEPVALILGKPTSFCRPIAVAGTEPVNAESHLVCFKAKRAPKRCTNAASLNVAAPCKNEAQCGGERGRTAYCAAQAKDAAASLDVAATVGSSLTLARDVTKVSELCLPASIE